MFDEAAACYDRVRPGYPERAIEEARTLAHLDEDSRILEIGCGTGQATLPFARLGMSILAIEPGPSLARLAQARLTGFPKVEVVLSDFESLDPESGPFDAVMAASVFPWLDPETRITKSAHLIREGGALILLTNVQRLSFEGFFDRAQHLLRAHAPEWPEPSRHPTWEQIPDQIEEVDEMGLFETVAVSSYDWRVTYPRDRYIEFLRTDPVYRSLGDAKMAALLKELGGLVDREFEGRVVTPFRTILHVARRTAVAAPLPVGASPT